MKALTVSTLFFLTSNLWAQTPVWTELFNGKDLKGWKSVGGQASYTVANGEIVGTSVKDSPNTFLVTERVYGDFILEVTFKIDPGINSGIQFRSELNATGRVYGYQAEIEHQPERGWSGGVYEESGRGWLYPVDLNPSAKSAYRWNDWNTYRIECLGKTIRTWVNNVPVSWVYDDRATSGFIGLQVHAIYRPEDEGKQVRWKSVRIQTTGIQSSPEIDMPVVNLIPNTIMPMEQRQGFRLLWDGKTTAGWRGAFGKEFPKKGWEIKDGVLTVLPADGGESANGGDIVTDEKFSAFELLFDFKISEGANSGVKYFVDEKFLSTGSAIGLEYQILDDERHPDAKLGSIGNRTMASLYDLIPSLKFPNHVNKPGEWNRGRVVVYPDNRVEHWLNGRKVVEYQRGTPVFFALVARSKYEKWEGFGMAASGPILLQDHGNAVSFRSIKIRALE